MKINAKNSAAIKTNVKIKIHRLEREREHQEERDRSRRKVIKLHLQFLRSRKAQGKPVKKEREANDLQESAQNSELENERER